MAGVIRSARSVRCGFISFPSSTFTGTTSGRARSQDSSGWRTQTDRMSGVLAGSIVLIGYLFAGFVDTSIGLVIILSGFAYISRCLRDAFADVPVPRELHITSGL